MAVGPLSTPILIVSDFCSLHEKQQKMINKIYIGRICDFLQGISILIGIKFINTEQTVCFLFAS